MASNRASLFVGAGNEEVEKGFDHLIDNFVPSFDPHYDFTSLSNLNTGYIDIFQQLENKYEQNGPTTGNDSPNMPTLSMSFPPTTVSFPEMKAKLTPDTSQAPNQSSIGSSDREIIKSELQRLVRNHENVTSTRFSIQQKRAKLREKRAASTNLGITLMRELNAHFAQEETPSPLLALFEQYQKSWAEYLLTENEYEDEEDKLDEGEYQLENTQQKIKIAIEQYDSDKGFIANLDPIQDQENPAPNVSFEAGAYPPLLAEYLTRCGTLDLVTERLWDLRMEHKEAFDDYQNGIGLRASQPNEDTIDLLTNFKKYEGEILHEKEALEREIEQLKTQCQEKGLFEDSLGLQLTDNELEAPLLDPLQSLPAYKHILWGRGTPRFFESALSQEPVETGAFINKWIFHQLCQSSLEVLQFRQSLSSQNVKVDSDEELLDLALRYWKFDGAAKPVSRPISEPCSDTFKDSGLKPPDMRADDIDLKPTVIHPSEADFTHRRPGKDSEKC
ncbi:hypothetical protein McanMca71_004516 [Microsporum canis]|uniref:Uncharacterized protein n=1 Tax=Arthroderma otae (strain ATCC MYA-4605 / CBS 113480) TaxID=554155 RepID=C5FP55_ARTOC|nr:conserved hypothetical protein [Microsporum canis CBS 113480]EEQ31371.1 conserved hypothetical protein [Microsporum canis CBS 113480]